MTGLPTPAVRRVASLPAMQRSSGIGRIGVKRRGQHTVLHRSYEEGSARVLFPGVSPGAHLEAVLINTSGGMTGGDRLSWRIELGEDCKLVATTQAAEKIYRAEAGAARMKLRLSLATNARLCWLPQETILFDASRLLRRVEADLGDGARLLICEPVVFGRRGHGEMLHRGRFEDRWSIRRSGRLVHAEAAKLEGDLKNMLSRQGTVAGFGAMATVLLIGDDCEALIGDVRAHLREHRDVISGCSSWKVGSCADSAGSGKLLARMLARDGYDLRQVLIPLLSMLNGGAALPKSWAS